MYPLEEIKKRQRAWAGAMGIPHDGRGYTRKVEDNLWSPLSDRARQGFERGTGSELRKHMRALHSSSALAANLFDHWTDRSDKEPLLSALGLEAGGSATLEFETQFPTGLGGKPPHLDVAITRPTCPVIAIECKFTEHFSRSTRAKSPFRETYFPPHRELWTEKGMPACQTLAEELWAEEILGRRQRFEYLNPRQLLKHALGLATEVESRFNLYYLYYDWTGERPARHREEVDLFAKRVGEDIGFRALTYQELYGRLRDSVEVNPEYLSYLEARYFG